MKWNLTDLAAFRPFRPALELFKQGEPADVVYVIYDGAVKLVWVDADGFCRRFRRYSEAISLILHSGRHLKEFPCSNAEAKRSTEPMEPAGAEYQCTGVSLLPTTSEGP
jgi:hypothetical protein